MSGGSRLARRSRIVGLAMLAGVLWSVPALGQTYVRNPIIRVFPKDPPPPPWVCLWDQSWFQAPLPELVIGTECVSGECLTQFPLEALLVRQSVPPETTVVPLSPTPYCEGAVPGVTRTEGRVSGLAVGAFYTVLARTCGPYSNYYYGPGDFGAITISGVPPEDPDWLENSWCALRSVDATSAWSWPDLGGEPPGGLARLKTADAADSSGSRLLANHLGSGLVISGLTRDVTGHGGNLGDAVPPSLSWADVDRDGDLDAVVGGPQLRLLLNHGNDSVSVETPASLSGASGAATWVDYDRDGVLDLAVTGDGLALYRGIGSAEFAAPVLVWSGASTRGQAWGDVNGDGWPDVYVCEPGGNDRLYQNAAGVLSQVALPSGAYEEAYGSSFAAWSDVDNDGQLDLVSSSSGLQGNRMLRNTGGVLEPDGVESARCLATGGGVIWGDVDNDGWSDLLLCSVAPGGAHRLLRNVSGGDFEEITPVGLPGSGAGHCGGLADVDQDGDLDLGVGVTGIPYGAGLPDYGYDTDRLLLNALPAMGRWMSIGLNGVTSNRSALGARVTVFAGGRRLVREIGGGDGWSQPPLACHFGVGSSTVADSVDIRWPGGSRQVFRNVPTNVHLEFTEGSPDGTVATGDLPAPGVLGLSVFPNPVRASASVRYSVPTASRVTLEILDVAGRRVLALHDAAHAPGRAAIVWDGRGSDGRQVESGVYFVRLRAAGEERRIPIVRTR